MAAAVKDNTALGSEIKARNDDVKINHGLVRRREGVQPQGFWLIKLFTHRSLGTLFCLFLLWICSIHLLLFRWESLHVCLQNSFVREMYASSTVLIHNRLSGGYASDSTT